MAKSDSIQHRYREIIVDPFLVSNFALEDRLNYAPQRYSDLLLDLMQELTGKINSIIETRLTPRQKQVIEKIYFEQQTQTEVAQELGLCQPTIHKILRGNIDYANGGKRYGGAIKKIRKICDNDTEIQSILSKIDTLKTEMSD
jgi:hypothetical protein